MYNITQENNLNLTITLFLIGIVSFLTLLLKGEEGEWKIRSLPAQCENNTRF